VQERGTVLRRKISTVTDKFVCCLIFISKTLRIAHLTRPVEICFGNPISEFLKLAAVYTYYLLFPRATLGTLLKKCINPVLFIRGISCSRSVQTSLTPYFLS
jgi:hypothetical protein